MLPSPPSFDHAPLCKATRSMSNGLGMTWTKDDYKNILEKARAADSLVKKVGKAISEAKDAHSEYIRTEYWTEECKQEKHDNMQGNQNRKGTTTSAAGRSHISMGLLGNTNGHGNKPAGTHEHHIISRSLLGHLMHKGNLINLYLKTISSFYVALSAFFDHAPLCKATRPMSNGLGMTWTKMTIRTFWRRSGCRTHWSRRSGR
jgi:hypothetical protein